MSDQRSRPPFEPAPRSDRDRLDAARRLVNRWHHDDPLPSVADRHDAITEETWTS